MDLEREFFHSIGMVWVVFVWSRFNWIQTIKLKYHCKVAAM